MNHQKPLLLESGLRWMVRQVRAFKLPLLASFLFGFLAYGFQFTNKLINHDEAFTLFFKGGSFTLGRWGLKILEGIFPNVSMPWIYGIITIALMAVSVCVIIHIFRIKNRLFQVLLAGSIMVCPSLTSTMAYMFTVSSYAVSFLMAVLTLLLMRKKSLPSYLAALCCMVFSLSIYQSYVAVTASLLVLMLVQRLLQEDDVKSVVLDGVIYVGFLAAAMIIYYGATQLIVRLTGISFNSYANGNLDLDLMSIPEKIGLAYRSFSLFFLESFRGLIPTALSRIMHWILAGTVILQLLLWVLMHKKQELSRLLLLAALLGILPLAINCMYLFTTEDAVHTLVLYGFVAVYVLAFLLADLCFENKAALARLTRRVCLEAASLAMAVTIISNIYIANEVSLNLYLRYENAFSFYTALAADMKMMPQFSENTRLAFGGYYRSPDFYAENFSDSNTRTADVYNLTGTAGFFPDNYSKNHFVEYYLGFPLSFASDEEAAAIMESPEYEQMPCYPYYGSMKFFGDTLMVKLS